MARRHESRVMVDCETCGISYDVSARTWRDIKRGKVQRRCVTHRQRRRPATVNAMHRRYWLERWSLDEIREVGMAIWPDVSTPAPPSTSAALLALAASGRRVEEPLTSPPELVEAARTARRRARALTGA